MKGKRWTFTTAVECTFEQLIGDEWVVVGKGKEFTTPELFEKTRFRTTSEVDPYCKCDYEEIAELDPIGECAIKMIMHTETGLMPTSAAH